MRRYLLVALWPAGLAAIAAATVIAARRAPVRPGLAAGDSGAPGGTEPAGTATADGGPRDGAQLAGITDRPPVRPDWPARDIVQFGAVTCAGAFASYGVMRLLGPTIMTHGPAIDEPVYRWTASHQVNWWAAVMERFNKIGHTWTIWGAAGAAAACLGVTWPRKKWLPPTALASAVVVDKYVTLALRHKFGRLGPPGSPLGTYPSGGCDRAVLFYGLVANLLWREFSGSYRGKVWAVGAVAALSFNVAYCREYLSKHWLTDIITGLLYGAVLLAPFLVAVRLAAGPAGLRQDADKPALPTAPRHDLAAALIGRAAELPPCAT